jgi:hypothetical protein
MNQRALECLIIALMVFRGWTEDQVSQLLALVLSIHEEEENPLLQDDDFTRIARSLATGAVLYMGEIK